MGCGEIWRVTVFSMMKEVEDNTHCWTRRGGPLGFVKTA